MRELLEGIGTKLPAHVYVHLSDALLDILEPQYSVEDHDVHQIMELVSDDAIQAISSSDVEELQTRDFDALEVLYEAAYPGHWFCRNMLENGPYVGIRDSAGVLISAGGAHVYSPRYGVATLGNIVTQPDHRGKGWGTLVTAKLCQLLLNEVDTIGLNVKADNRAAIHIYESLNFRKLADYSEMTLRAN